MSKLPQRNSLPKQAAAIISQMIQDGEIKDFLPGERDLASRLQIGRDTLRMALELLEKQDLITPSQHGKRRQITHQARIIKSSSVQRIAFLSPKTLTELPPWMLVEVNILRDLLNRQGYEFEFINAGVFHLSNPNSRLKKLTETHNCDAWILHQCPAPIQQWFQDNDTPAIIRGYAHSGVKIQSIDDDWRAAAFHAGGELARNGHKNIGLLIPNTGLAGLIATETGLREAIESNHKGTVHKFEDKVSMESVQRALELAFKLDNPPTAIVVTRPRQTLNTITWLAQHRIRIPQDLSIISLAYEAWYDHITPKISHYHGTPETFAKAVMRAINKGLDKQSNKSNEKLIIPQFFKGASVKMLD